jgi:hypothetical protein
MSTGNSVRGLYDPMLYQMVGQYAMIAVAMNLCETKSWTDFQDELKSQKTYPISNRDVMRYIHRSGYLGHHGIAELVDRLTGIKLSFACAAGTLPLEEYLMNGGERKRMPSPSEVLKDFLALETIVHAKKSGFDQKSEFALNNEDEARLKAWLLESKDWDIRSRRDQMYIPSSFIKDSLNGMRIPLPYRPPLRPVRGSEADEGRNPNLIGWVTEVISLRRIHS